MKKAHLVTVLGREIPVRTAVQPEKVQQIEQFVHEQVEAIRTRLTTADPQLVVTLALLNLAETYLDLQARSQPDRQYDARLGQLIGRLEQVLAAPGLSRET